VVFYTIFLKAQAPPPEFLEFLEIFLKNGIVEGLFTHFKTASGASNGPEIRRVGISPVKLVTWEMGTNYPTSNPFPGTFYSIPSRMGDLGNAD